MYALKVITIFLDVVFSFVMAAFMRSFKWTDERNRASIIGFFIMIIIYFMNILCIQF